MPPEIRQALSIVGCVAAILGSSACWSSPPPSDRRFPGEQMLPKEVAGPDQLVKILYGNRLTVIDPQNCGNAPCNVRLVGNQIFKDAAGGLQAVVVTAAEPAPAHAYHAASAVLGMAWLVHTGAGWKLDLGSPSVVSAGANGVAPEVFIMEGGIWGKVIALQWFDTHQGVGERYWQMFVPDRTNRSFVLGLELQTENESSGACADTPATASCLNNDFETALSLVTEKDGITVTATTTYPSVLHRQATSKVYHVTKSDLGQ